MILGYHVIFGAYGFWLPNDPRGSWSNFVGSWELFRLGPATRVQTRTSLARQPHDRDARLDAKQALKLPAVKFAGVQARAIGRGFTQSVHKGKVIVWACSILPEHVHLVIARHQFKVESVINQLKGAATRALLAEDLHPLAHLKDGVGSVPKCWAEGEWKVYLDSEEAIQRAIKYVRHNPVKGSKPAQAWSFVTPFVPTGAG
jgi:REP element-mobilizing transposase RayT